MTTDATPEHAGTTPASNTPDLGPAVPFPPPLLFVGGFALGVAASRIWPLALPWSMSRTSMAVGLSLVALGVALAITGVVTFRRAKVAVYPNRPARHLVTHGIYQYTRNPMYVGMTTAYLGGVVMTGIAWGLVMLPLVLIVLFAAVIQREERHLTERFPDEFRAYSAQVRRWL
jgi:protein-S-isoprenylcysteine O-methyltransferase Ste14